MKRTIIPGFVEIALLCIIISIFFFGAFNPPFRAISEICILITIYCWAILVFFGWLTPVVYRKTTLAFDVNPEHNVLGYPILLSLKSRGGFICNYPITIKAKVLSITTSKGKGNTYKTVELFKQTFTEFDIIWSSSKAIKQNKPILMEDGSEIGGVQLNTKTCSGKSSIVFTAPGKQCCRFMYKTRAGIRVLTPLPKEEEAPDTFLYVSPPETLYQIRIGNIIYALLLVILSFWLRSILISSTF